MKKGFILTFIGLILISAVGCTHISEAGVLITASTEHLATPGHQNNLGNGKVVKSGESCNYATWALNYNLIFHGPKNSINDIAVAAGIQKIAVVDHSSFNILGPVFYKNCIIVWGE
ncbi:TRL domain-containing protein [Leptospira sp. 'Mane']|uniref:TRL domain-containing protein n=1 Tax=Leptospira sp. 'Mane' TaxID=3387407 RepID=UPI00398B91E2